ncbi:MAG: hypothetical protein D6743_09170 [Calditrichaeota bacterium]|nr:MAG: hypothetical protein D6743_09170 [Calditrichota bacterium]
MFFAISLSMEIIGTTLTSSENGLWLSHIYTLIEYTFLATIFSLWQDNKGGKKVIKISILLFAIIWTVSKFTIENFHTWDSYTSPLEGLLLIIIASYTLYALGRESEVPIYEDARFWISSGVLIYFTVNLMGLALMNLIQNWNEQRLFVRFPIHSLSNIFCNLLYTGGFLCLLRRTNCGGSSSSAPASS